jgi:hypothetical protein
MKVHSLIVEDKPDYVDLIKKNAKKVGLDKIDFDGFYTVKKLGAKNPSPRGYPDAYTVIKGSVVLIGNKEEVALYFNGLSDWFKTSAIISCKKVKNGYKVETTNSLYLLED